MAQDNFTDANNTPLSTHDANWADANSGAPVSRFQIESNQCQATATSTTAGARYTASNSDTSQIVFVGGSTGNFRHVSVRANGTSKGYDLQLSAVSAGNFTHCNIDKDGTFLVAINGSWATASDHTVKIVASGTSPVTIEAWVDGVKIGSTTDSTSPLGTGNPGFWIGGGGTLADTTFDTWSDGQTTVSLAPQRSLIGFGQ